MTLEPRKAEKISEKIFRTGFGFNASSELATSMLGTLGSPTPWGAMVG